MAYENLTLDRRGHVAVVTLNRPDKLNALSADLRREMHEALAELRDDDNVRAVVWTGAGRGFCAGVDLTGGGTQEAPPKRSETLDEYGWVGRHAIGVYRFDKPTIAAVNGPAAGAGMSLALACDLRIGSYATRFKVVFIERNLSPDSGMSYFLPRIVGYSRACDLVYTSRTVEGEEAFRIGLLDRLVPAERLLEEAVALGEQVAFWPPMAMQMSKRALQSSMERSLEDQLRYETTAISYARRAANDAREARLSFIEKRRPVFTGT
jgi:2-(1,2-epoxy-1,2-dihydrophenyl)acetyl-CoA isomerase